MTMWTGTANLAIVCIQTGESAPKTHRRAARNPVARDKENQQKRDEMLEGVITHADDRLE